MFKLFMFFIILFLAGIVMYSTWKLFTMSFLKNEVTLPKQEKINIDQMIEELEFKIMRAELQAENGVKEAEESLAYLKDQLDKARTLRNKIK
jgi:hypothetical protein